MNSRAEHWQALYRTKDPATFSWYQAEPRLSRELIAATGVSRSAAILDVGGGASLLVDSLLSAGFSDLTVLDIAADALAHAQRRLGPRVKDVAWLTADVTAFDSPRRYGLWHDRAVFHFLTEPADRLGYVSSLRRSLAPNGHVILATFGPHAPDRCSGLPVVRYDPAGLAAALGPGFSLRRSEVELHRTPRGPEQEFVYCWFEAAA